MQLEPHRSDNVLVLLEPSLHPDVGHRPRNAEAFARAAASAGRPFVLHATERMSEEQAEELRALGAEIIPFAHVSSRLPRRWIPLISSLRLRRAASAQLAAFRNVAKRMPKATIVCPSAKPQTLWAAAQVNWGPTQRVVLQFLAPERWGRHPGKPGRDGLSEVPEIYRNAARVVAARGGVLATQSPDASAYLAREFGCPVRTLPLSCLDWTGALPEKADLRPTPRIGVLNFSRGGKLHAATIEAARRTADRVDWVIRLRPSDWRTPKLRPLVDQVPRLEVVEGALPSDEYNDLVASLDAILLPYDAESFRLRMSGLVIDAMCQAVIPLAPADSAPAAVMTAEGLGVTFEPGNADGIVAAVEEFLGRRAELAARALSRAPDCRKRHTAAGFLAACES